MFIQKLIGTYTLLMRIVLVYKKLEHNEYVVYNVTSSISLQLYLHFYTVIKHLFFCLHVCYNYLIFAYFARYNVCKMRYAWKGLPKCCIEIPLCNSMHTKQIMYVRMKGQILLHSKNSYSELSLCHLISAHVGCIWLHLWSTWTLLVQKPVLITLWGLLHDTVRCNRNA